MSVVHRRTHEWTLWVVAASCALHVLEEYFTGWQQWARESLGIVMPATRFLVMNLLLVVAALILARIGWRWPALSLVIPAATLVNAVIFHIIPTILQNRVSPGVYTASLLYLPFSSWAFVGARRDGVSSRAMALGFMIGTILMLTVVLVAKSMS
jgi:hypothetical protein